MRKKSVAPGPGGLEDHMKNPGATDLFGQVRKRNGFKDGLTKFNKTILKNLKNTKNS